MDEGKVVNVSIIHCLISLRWNAAVELAARGHLARAPHFLSSAQER
jgi:hypothetical protein